MTSNIFYKVDCRARETRMHFYMRFREPKLYRYAKEFRYADIEERCRAHPRKAAREAKFRHEYPPEQSALHRVLEPHFLLGMEETAIDWKSMAERRHRAAAALLKANPDAALVTCTFGTTPLAMACMDPHGSLDDVNMLLMKCPKCALKKDTQGRVPLHYACINNRANLDMIKSLLDHCREAATSKDNFGRLPLHYATLANPNFSGYQGLEDRLNGQSRKAPLCTEAVMTTLLEANKEGVSATDKDGLAPLHYMCKYLDACSPENITLGFLSVAELLVSAGPEVAVTDYGNGRTPIAVFRDCRRRVASNDSCARRMEVLEEILQHCAGRDKYS